MPAASPASELSSDAEPGSVAEQETLELAKQAAAAAPAHEVRKTGSGTVVKRYMLGTKLLSRPQIKKQCISALNNPHKRMAFFTVASRVVQQLWPHAYSAWSAVCTAVHALTPAQRAADNCPPLVQVAAAAATEALGGMSNTADLLQTLKTLQQSVHQSGQLLATLSAGVETKFADVTGKVDSLSAELAVTKAASAAAELQATDALQAVLTLNPRVTTLAQRINTAAAAASVNANQAKTDAAVLDLQQQLAALKTQVTSLEQLAGERYVASTQRLDALDLRVDDVANFVQEAIVPDSAGGPADYEDPSSEEVSAEPAGGNALPAGAPVDQPAVAQGVAVQPAAPASAVLAAQQQPAALLVAANAVVAAAPPAPQPGLVPSGAGPSYLAAAARGGADAGVQASTKKGPAVKIPAPSNYSGDHRSRVEVALFSFENYLTGNRVPREDWVLHVNSLLTGRAQTVWHSRAQQAAAKGESLTWDMFKACMTANFGSPLETLTARQKLHDIKQTGSVQDYIQHFNTLVTSVGADTPCQSDLVMWFLHGLKPALHDRCRFDPRTSMHWTSLPDLQENARLLEHNVAPSRDRGVRARLHATAVKPKHKPNRPFPSPSGVQKAGKRPPTRGAGSPDHKRNQGRHLLQTAAAFNGISGQHQRATFQPEGRGAGRGAGGGGSRSGGRGGWNGNRSGGDTVSLRLDRATYNGLQELLRERGLQGGRH